MKNNLRYLLLIISIFISAVIETDIYLPAFTDMMHFFKQSEENIQRILTWNFIGLCVAGPIYGPLSDSYGRRKPLLFALILFFLGSLITLFVDQYEWLLLGRILQGLGSGGCFTIGTAIIFDVFKEKQAIDALNKINVIVPFIMASAPLLGGYLNQTYGFRSNFYAIAFCVFTCLTCCFLFLKETLKKDLRTPLNIQITFNNFLRVFKNLQFIQLTLVISLVFAGFITFISSVAVLFVVEFGVDKAQFPYYQFSLLTAYLLASLTCTKIISKFGITFVKKLGMSSTIAASIILVAISIIYPKNPHLLTLAMIPFACGYIWIQTPYVTEVMELIPDIKGIAASILTSLRLLVSAGVVALTARSYNSTIMPITIAIFLISLFVFLLSYFYEKNKQINSKIEP